MTKEFLSVEETTEYLAARIAENQSRPQPLRCLSGMCGMPAMKRSNYCEYHGKEMAWHATTEGLGVIGSNVLAFVLFLSAIVGVAGAIFLITGLVVWSQSFWGARIP